MSKLYRLSLSILAITAVLTAVALRPVAPAYAACTNTGDYPAGVNAHTPIVYYRMGEGAGTTATNTGSLGAAANGTYSGVTLGATSLVANDANTAVNFNGTTSFITMADNAAINTGGPYTARTIEFIFGAGDTTGRQLLFEEGGTSRGLAIYLDGSTLYMGGWNTPNDGAGSPWGPSYITTTISANIVYHVALVFAGNNTTTGTLTGYVNGVQVGQATGIGQLYGHADDTGLARTNQNTRYHDNTGNNVANFFNGRIDEFAMYSTALTPAQINAHITDCFGPLAVALGGANTAAPFTLNPWLLLVPAVLLTAASTVALRRRQPTA